MVVAIELAPRERHNKGDGGHKGLGFVESAP